MTVAVTVSVVIALTIVCLAVFRDLRALHRMNARNRAMDREVRAMEEEKVRLQAQTRVLKEIEARVQGTTIDDL